MGIRRRWALASLVASVMVGTPPAANALGDDEPLVLDGHCTFVHRGKVAEGLYEGGARTGAWSFYRPDGSLEARGAFAAGRRDGDWVFLYPDGQPRLRGRYAAGQPVGEWEWLAPDGKQLTRRQASAEGWRPIAGAPATAPKPADDAQGAPAADAAVRWSPEEVDQRYQAQLPRMLDCHRRHMAWRADDGDVRAKLLLAITADGRVTSADLQVREFGFDEFAACAEAVFLEADFVAPSLAPPRLEPKGFTARISIAFNMRRPGFGKRPIYSSGKSRKGFPIPVMDFVTCKRETLSPLERDPSP